MYNIHNVSLSTYLCSLNLSLTFVGDERWTTCVYTNQEAAVVNNLKPETNYRFRVSATNRFGASAYSWASAESLTKPKGLPLLIVWLLTAT